MHRLHSWVRKFELRSDYCNQQTTDFSGVDKPVDDEEGIIDNVFKQRRSELVRRFIDVAM